MGPEFYRNVLTARSPLEAHEQNLCVEAVFKFRANPGQRGVGFEILNGPKGHNLYAIRGDRDLRVLLAIDDERQICVLANAGHHDIYDGWVKNHRHYYDPDDAVRMHGSVREACSLDEFRGALEQAWASDFGAWRLFLHPEEERLIQAHWQGAARIRGTAGTGKSVVALHRAAILAERYPRERILLTAPHRALCKRLQVLYRLLPGARDNVEFMHIDDLALALSGGITAGRRVDQDQVDAAFEVAFQRVVTGTSLAQLGRTYLREEIELVIKGRGVSQAAAYLDTDSFERLGRKCSFPLSIRAQVWALYEAWNHEMQVRHTVHRWDNTRLGCDNVHRLSRGIYRCAIVDEAQDMSLVSMQLVRGLVAGAAANPLPKDGLLLLDDAAQRFYAGGFRLRWANLDVKGRSFGLYVNYRNTRKVLEAAQAVRGKELVVREPDGDHMETRNDGHDGYMPRLVRVADFAGELRFMRDEIRRLTQDEGYDPGEIGILLRDHQDATRIIAYLRDRSGFACTWLCQATRPDTLQVGTFRACKGFEFRAVFIPRLTRTGSVRAVPLPETASPGKDRIGTRELQAVTQEANLLARDHLYVAMTRAREYLVLIADGEPSPAIQAVRHHFACQDLSPLYPAQPD